MGRVWHRVCARLPASLRACARVDLLDAGETQGVDQLHQGSDIAAHHADTRSLRLSHLHKETDLVRSGTKPRHAFDNPRQNFGEAHSNRQQVVERVIVPIHLGESQSGLRRFVPGPVTGMAYESYGLRRAAPTLEKGFASAADALDVAMHPKQGFARP